MMIEEESIAPPHSIIAEQSLIGAILVDNATWDRVADKIVANDFYNLQHRLIWEFLSELAGDSQPMDIVTLVDRLERAGELEDAGGFPYLVEMINNTASSSNAPHYADSIRELASQRELIKIGEGLRDAAFSRDGRLASALAQETEQRLVDAFSDRDDGGLRHIQPGLVRAVEEIDKVYLAGTSGDKSGRVFTGYADLDARIGHLKPGALCIVAGRPGMGKSILASNIAEHAAVSLGKSVGIFSVEMPESDLLMRMISSQSRLDYKNLQEGKLRNEEWHLMTNAVMRLKNAPIYVDDSSTLTPMQLRSRSLKAHRQFGPLDLIVVDYLQYLHVPGAKTANRVMEVTQISRDLTSLAKELNVPIIAVSQLNRALSGRTDKRPVMSDLRDSGALEQDASLILFLHREEVYDENTQDRGVAEVIIGKQRNGPIGTVRLISKLERMRFESSAAEEWGRQSA